MKDEIFDVVDDQDRVIGRETRRHVHQTGLKHRAVHIFIFNSKGEIFLQKRSMLKDNFPGVWDSSASGHLDSGEDYDPCAVRELREELGLAIKQPLERLFKVDACQETGQEFAWLYRGFDEGPFVLHPDEISEGGWFSPAQVADWIMRAKQDFAPAFVLLWELYLGSTTTTITTIKPAT